MPLFILLAIIAALFFLASALVPEEAAESGRLPITNVACYHLSFMLAGASVFAGLTGAN